MLFFRRRRESKHRLPSYSLRFGSVTTINVIRPHHLFNAVPRLTRRAARIIPSSP